MKKIFVLPLLLAASLLPALTASAAPTTQTAGGGPELHVLGVSAAYPNPNTAGPPRECRLVEFEWNFHSNVEINAASTGYPDGSGQHLYSLDMTLDHESGDEVWAENWKVQGTNQGFAMGAGDTVPGPISDTGHLEVCGPPGVYHARAEIRQGAQGYGGSWFHFFDDGTIVIETDLEIE